MHALRRIVSCMESRLPYVVGCLAAVPDMSHNLWCYIIISSKYCFSIYSSELCLLELLTFLNFTALGLQNASSSSNQQQERVQVDDALHHQEQYRGWQHLPETVAGLPTLSLNAVLYQAPS